MMCAFDFGFLVGVGFRIGVGVGFKVGFENGLLIGGGGNLCAILALSSFTAD